MSSILANWELLPVMDGSSQFWPQPLLPMPSVKVGGNSDLFEPPYFTIIMQHINIHIILIVRLLRFYLRFPLIFSIFAHNIRILNMKGLGL